MFKHKMNNTNKDLQQTSPSYHSDEQQLKSNDEQPKSNVATGNHLNSESIPKQIAIAEGKPWGYALDFTFLSQLTPTYEGNTLSASVGTANQYSISKFLSFKVP